MARATRSATQHQDKDKPQDQVLPHRAKPGAKKRKRVSLPEDDQPAAKQHRGENGIKEETTDDKLSKGKLPELEHVADVPLDPLIAQKVLEILEMVDSQGLLDRVFPLPATNPSEPSTSKSQTGTYSLRTLLKESTQHPLRVLRSAVQNLFPMTYHARSRTSSPAAQQLRFCNLALSLLDQASFHSVTLPLDIETIIPLAEPSAVDGDSKPPLSPSLSDKLSQTGQGKRYALMQRLPSGSWWSSLSSDLLPDSKDFKDIQTANAELVAIFPSPSSLAYTDDNSKSTITLTDTQTPTTLGAYVPKKPPGHRSKLPGPRRVSCGSFLDYGPYASFAPAFDQEGVEVGREALGEVLWGWEHQKKAWAVEKSRVAKEAAQWLPMEGLHPTEGGEGLEEQSNSIDPSLQEGHNDDDDVLEGLLSKEQVASLKSVLKTLELEDAVQELLDRNAKALKRLEELQKQRLMKQGGFHPVEEGTEEWDTAQGILESLTILATLRPRQSGSEDVPLIPSTTTLRKLHRTLPVTPSQGWYGTLPTGRTTALRDDSTLYIKSTATAVPSQPAVVPTPTPAIPAATPVAATSATAQNYSQYSYNYAAGYRGGYQYKPGQATSYYPSSYTPGQTQAATQYYANQQYPASGQQQYSYSSWYQYQPQTAAANTSTGQVPPQTGATPTPTATIPTSYAGFFSNTAQSGQRAVANTVTAKPQQTAAGTTGYMPPTLPPHMRTAAAGSTAQQGAYAYQPNYYGAYQAQAQQAQTAASPAQ
ncbi:hypothetical protein AZE42_11617 [Rhizopogon vesiculosus]|uniref:Uncharacterized protein n=1 Tax=Rhizopogon vesiculosus TaxID=180088 RepID=A0A1J8RAT0_9AGAM|nr:hypothetical protein AZE42_11617 [Rhizopogon vesiculosus]